MPEIGPHLSRLAVRIDPTLSRPFVLDGRSIRIRPDRAATVTGSALVLREAIELDTVGFNRVTWADRILAHATAIVFGATTLMPRGETAARAAFTPLMHRAPDILALHDVAATADAGLPITRDIASFLEERDQSPGPCPEADVIQAARALAYSVPTEVLLALGGDDRLLVDWSTGVNKYGIAPSPTPWTSSLSSCTASAPTSRAFDAAARLRRLLIEAALADDLDRTVAAHYEVMRRMLLAALGAHGADGVEVVFTPSGTDAEFVPLLVALSTGDAVNSIVVGQHEIGSGSIHSAAGRHFCTNLPSGDHVTAGQALDGLDDAKITISTVDVRDSEGNMLTPDALERRVEEAILRHPEYRALVHAVEGSKTGIRLPRAETIKRWRERFGDRIDVVVDAAQMRIDQHTAVAHLENDAMVIVTGSKFFGGPPFSGAVLIPRSLTGRLAKGRALAPGVGGYLAKAEVPESLPALHDIARPGLNAGLLVRWEAALAEVRSFHNSSPEIRDEILRLFAAGLRRILEHTPRVSLVESPYTPIPKHDDRGLDDLPTIFTFLVKGTDGQPLGEAQADQVYRLLARDMSGLPVNDPVLSRTFQLGQAVKISRRDGAWVAGLRVAIGAPTISQVVFDHTRGRTWTERVDRCLADVADALRKLDLIVQHVDLRQLAS